MGIQPTKSPPTEAAMQRTRTRASSLRWIKASVGTLPEALIAATVRWIIQRHRDSGAPAVVYSWFTYQVYHVFWRSKITGCLYKSPLYLEKNTDFDGFLAVKSLVYRQKI